MEIEEKDYEIILEKLERMEDFLKSYVAGLEKENKRLEFKLTPIRSKAMGIIHRWHFSTGDRVREGDRLCDINRDPENPTPTSYQLASVSSPAGGMLNIIEFYRRKGSPVSSTGAVLGHIESR